MTDETRNRRILVGDGIGPAAMIDAVARLAAADIPAGWDEAMDRVLLTKRELPPPVFFLPALRETRHRDWEDRKKPRPNPKRGKQRAQKMARRRQRNRR